MHEWDVMAKANALSHSDWDHLVAYHSLVRDTTTSPHSLVLLMECVQGMSGPSVSLKELWQRTSLNAGQPLPPALHRSLVRGMLRSLEQCHSQVRRQTGRGAALQVFILLCVSIGISVHHVRRCIVAGSVC